MNEVEIQELALQIAIDYVKEKGQKAGMTNLQGAAILARWGKESADMPRSEAIAGFLTLFNFSALRIKLEKKGVLITTAQKMATDYDSIA